MTAPKEPYVERPGVVVDPGARDSAKTAMIIAAIAGLIAIAALIIALVHVSQNFAPQKCDPKSDYVCHPTTTTQTTSVPVPTTTLSPTVTSSVVP